MDIKIVIKPALGTPVAFGSYPSLGDAFHIALSLEQHMRFQGTVHVEERLSPAEQILHGGVEMRRYELPNNR